MKRLTQQLAKQLQTLVMLMALLGGSVVAQAEIVVVTHPSNKTELNDQQIARIFQGKLRAFPSGEEATPYDLPLADQNRRVFTRTVLHQTPRQLRAFWAKLIFSGKGIPPEIVTDSVKMKELVSRNRSAIGYMDATLVDDSVRVIRVYSTSR